MLPVLEFIFASFWRWLGTFLLIVAFSYALSPWVTVKWTDRR